MSLVQRNDMVEQFVSAASDQRSATPFCQGLWTEDCTHAIFMDRIAAGTSNPYFASWSKMRNLLRTGKTSIVPSSQGIIGASWTTLDTLVAATENTTELLTFSFKTQKWTELASGAFVNWAPSLDSKYLYYTTGGAEPKALRLRFTDHEIETVTSLKDLRRVVDSLEQNTQISVAPDGSPVFTRDIGTQEIYALNVRWP